MGVVSGEFSGDGIGYSTLKIEKARDYLRIRTIVPSFTCNNICGERRISEVSEPPPVYTRSFSMTRGSTRNCAAKPNEGVPPQGYPVFAVTSSGAIVQTCSTQSALATREVLARSSPVTIATMMLPWASVIQIFLTKFSGSAPTVSAASATE